MTPDTARSIVVLLDEAIQNVPDFREGLTEQALDRNLARSSAIRGSINGAVRFFKQR
jgi:hypothetical protein